jgi:PAS domain S-box-containing protein
LSRRIGRRRSSKYSNDSRVDHFETVRHCKDGTLLDISLTISPVKDQEGRIIGASKIARDITQRRTFERRLAEQAHLLDLTGDAILARDKEDRIVYWNRAAEELYGFSREEALGRISHELLCTEFPEPLPTILETLAREGRWSGELGHAGRSGSRIITLSRWVTEEQRVMLEVMKERGTPDDHKPIQELEDAMYSITAVDQRGLGL